MRSQASKTSPNKEVVSKTQLKTKRAKKKTVAKKIKKVIRKPLVKLTKKNTSKSDKEGEVEDKNESHLETRASTSKSNPSQSVSPTKKTRKDLKEKKDPNKTLPDNTVKKANIKKTIQKKTAKKLQPSAKTSDELKYKVKDEPKKTLTKFSKAKPVVKKGKPCASDKKENTVQKKPIIEKKVNDDVKTSKEIETKSYQETEDSHNKEEKKETTKFEENNDIKETDLNPTLDSIPANVPIENKPETPKQEVERPPKFFTSSRSPRMVDIDVKCCKNSKGNLSVSERFVSLKCEIKSNEDKNVPNTLVTQGPEIDVYTFTEKVDSPKSILSDIRTPINQTTGRVRPIARVKGTVIDKKTESDRKKFSPHRPIEEVVQQLKAKKSEEVSANQSNASGSFSLNISNDAKDDEAPKPIVSKSYKMVARKSSVTGIPFSPIKFPEHDVSPSYSEKSATKSDSPTKKTQIKRKKKNKSSSSDDELESSKFSFNTKTFQYSSSDECDNNDSNDETKESSTSDTSIAKKPKNKRYKKITDNAKKTTSKELKELSKDSLVDLKEDFLGMKKKDKQPHHRPLHKYWKGPKKQRMALLNAKLVVQNLLANEFQTNMDLGLMKTVAMQPIPSTSKRPTPTKKKEIKLKDSEKHETTSESEYENTMEKKDDSSESSDDSRPQRTLRGEPGIRSAGKYWDPKSCSSSSEDSEMETKKKVSPEKKKITKTALGKSDSDKPAAKIKKTAGAPVKKKRNRNEVNMDFKDMVVQKRMASLNASAMIELSYEKRSPKSNKEETTTDSGSDESFSQKPKNGVGSGVKSESKNEEPKQEPESDETAGVDSKQKVEVVVNQDTDVTITGVYSTHLHHNEGYCTVSGMHQYRISSTSHTQTTATANCEKEGCSRDDAARYTPLSALSSMQPPAEHVHSHSPHSSAVPELGGLSAQSRRAGCSSAFSAPSPSAHHDPGYYQPAGPLIKETNNEDRALARYHSPHYHAPHPQMLPQYGPPYYPDLCYGRYYRPPGPPYPMPPPHTQADAPMGGIPGEPYPPPQYYGAPQCYQHSPQRIPSYVEYRGCPCPLNACPKNVLIGPATGKAPAGAGPDVPSALVPSGGAFRSKVRTCALDSAADNHGSGKDPPLEPEPPAGADVPHPCPVPTIGGASPKRELFDVRDNIRIASEVHGPGEAIGPPSPARGSAGVCAPQPPPSAPRRARLGKAMARRSLAGDDTQGLLLSVQQPAQVHSDADDDVVEISSPPCAPIDLSSSDERTTPLVDIKKENEGPTFASARKPDAQALREHNSTTADTTFVTDSPKAVKRRYSRPNLEIDMKDTQLEEGCKTNGIGEHVKLIKRRKISGDQPEAPRVETILKEPKKKPMQPRRAPKSPPAEKKNVKRKLDTSSSRTRAKKILLDSPSDENPKVSNGVPTNGVQLVKEKDDLSTQIPKTKSALLLDNLIRKNSIDRADTEKELNPAELFLSPIENIAQNCSKKMFNINNNVMENVNTGVGIRPNTIAAVTQLIEKKLAYKNACKLEKVDSKVTHKSVLKPPIVKPGLKEDSITFNKCDLTEIKNHNGTSGKETPKPMVVNEKEEVSKDKVIESSVVDKITPEIMKPMSKDDVPAVDKIESQRVEDRNGFDLNKEETNLAEVAKVKRCKMTEIKAKNVEKVVKLLVSKRPAVKTDEATLVVEEACASPVPGAPRRARRRRGRRGRRLLTPAALPDLEPKAPPRWSNGWNWDGEHYISKVYLNNDSRLDRMARCWSRMTHTSGDKVARGDCVLLRASVARAQPFVARVASLWENPDDGEMMVSLVWYYRPEHTAVGRQPMDAPDEVFGSRHRDANSVACIEDKCYVLTSKEYCRYRKRLKAAEEGVKITPTIVPPLPTSEMNPAFAPMDSKLPPTISPELVLFSHRKYDFRTKKIYVPNKLWQPFGRTMEN